MRNSNDLPFRTAYEPTVDVSTVNDEPSLTDQSQKAATDVHNILKTYDKTGVITHVAKHTPHYDDVSDIGDYQSAMNRIVQVRETFDGLPLKLRREFDHDPKKFIEFMVNPENHEKAYDLGLLQRPTPAPAPEPTLEPDAEPTDA